TQQNLAAVLAQVNLERPEASPLLVKAASMHGDMAQAPLKGRQLPAYHTLEEWTRSVVATNPQLRERSKGAVVASAPEAKPDRKVATEAVVPKPELVAAPSTSARPFPASNPAGPTTAPAEAQSTVPLDPYDPVLFNQQMHPNRKGPTQK